MFRKFNYVDTVLLWRPAVTVLGGLRDKMTITRIMCAAGLMIAGASAAAAQDPVAVLIKNGSTVNMTCSATPIVCSPTNPNLAAVLGASDLKSMLRQNAVTVSTGSATGDIAIVSAVTLPYQNGLTLNANQSIVIDKNVTVSGSAVITLTTNTGGECPTCLLAFGSGGAMDFTSTSNGLIINGLPYLLVNSTANNTNSLQTLAADIAATPGGNYALGASYNAAGDGPYSATPIQTSFSGNFEGLGNSISNITVNNSGSGSPLCSAVFVAISSSALIADVNFTNINISAGGGAQDPQAAGLVCSTGIHTTISGSSVGGSVEDLVGAGGKAGGLVASSGGTIINSYSTATVSSPGYSLAGGLVALLSSSIVNSHATGAVTSGGYSSSGGLVALGGGYITNSYGTGAVTGGDGGFAGGLVGLFDGDVNTSFSTSSVYVGNISGSNGVAGGLIGLDQGASVNNSYSTGSVNGGDGSLAGGFIGADDFGNGGANNYSYSTGHVTGGTGTTLGGFIGCDGEYTACGATSESSFLAAYWDTTTSHIRNLGQGAGNILNDPGIAGLTNAQLKSGLPPGFSSAIWGQSKTINGGLPYLLNNPPPK